MSGFFAGHCVAIGKAEREDMRSAVAFAENMLVVIPGARVKRAIPECQTANGVCHWIPGPTLRGVPE